MNTPPLTDDERAQAVQRLRESPAKYSEAVGGLSRLNEPKYGDYIPSTPSPSPALHWLQTSFEEDLKRFEQKQMSMEQVDFRREARYQFELSEFWRQKREEKAKRDEENERTSKQNELRQIAGYCPTWAKSIADDRVREGKWTAEEAAHVVDESEFWESVDDALEDTEQDLAVRDRLADELAASGFDSIALHQSVTQQYLEHKISRRQFRRGLELAGILQPTKAELEMDAELEALNKEQP